MNSQNRVHAIIHLIRCFGTKCNNLIYFDISALKSRREQFTSTKNKIKNRSFLSIYLKICFHDANKLGGEGLRKNFIFFQQIVSTLLLLLECI